MAETAIENTKPNQGFCPSGQTTISDLTLLDNMDTGLDELLPYVQSRAGNYNSIDLLISGAHCSGCMAKIERGIGEMENIKLARMNLSTMRLNVQWDGEPEMAGDIVAKLQNMGYGAKPFNMELAPLEQEKHLKTLLLAMAVAGFAMVNVMLLSIGMWDGSEMSSTTRQMLQWISAAIAIPASAYAGRPFFSSAIKALKNRQTNMDVPISLGVILALALSLWETIHKNEHTYFEAATMLLFLLLIGRYLDQKMRLKTGESAQRLAAMQSSTANLMQEDGSIVSVPSSMIKPGDKLLIAAGERVPVDGEIIKGQSEIDTSIATGETIPLKHKIGDKIYSGMINLTSALTIKANAVSSDSFLSEISRLVEAGEQKKSRFVRIADKAARAYVPVVHTLAALTFIGWLLVGGELRTAALNSIAVLIITCPCALGLAVPAVQVVASGNLFKKGVLIKSGDALERLAEVDTVIFDKTGTLTLGSLSLVNLDEISDEDLQLAAKLARASRHPVSRAITIIAGRGEVADEVKEVAGKGLQAKIEGKTVRFGSAGFVGVKNKSENDYVTTSWLKVGNKKPIAFYFKDSPRMDAVETVKTLKKQGLKVELLTGDKEEIAQEIAKQMGIEKWHAGILPEQKLSRLNELAKQGYKTLMVGDGINDAPALAAAHASASPASAADISRASADIILQGNRLNGIIHALEMSKKANKRVKENLWASVIYNMFAVPLAVFGFVTPMIAAIAMSGSSLIVTLNALRLKGK